MTLNPYPFPQLRRLEAKKCAKNYLVMTNTQSILKNRELSRVPNGNHGNVRVLGMGIFILIMPLDFHVTLDLNT